MGARCGIAGLAVLTRRSEVSAAKLLVSSQPGAGPEPEAGGCAAFRPLLVVSKMNLQVLGVARVVPGGSSRLAS
jgi:hypothetical protein